MKPLARLPNVEPPGALASETLGASSNATTTETTCSAPHSTSELILEVEEEGVDHPHGSPPKAQTERRTSTTATARSAVSVARVLVVDDSPVIRDVLAEALTKEGYEVLLAANGEEGLEQFAPGLIDLVVLDLEMPVKSGWATFEEIVKLHRDQAFVLMAERLDAVDFPTSGHFTRLAEKPINLGALLASVRAALSESMARRRSTLASQQSLMRYAHPFVSSSSTGASYDHWGIND